MSDLVTESPISKLTIPRYAKRIGVFMNGATRANSDRITTQMTVNTSRKPREILLL
jgi:hypothetical protein